ncbi:MAG: LCP family protein [Anaerolineae bacterium]
MENFYSPEPDEDDPYLPPDDPESQPTVPHMPRVPGRDAAGEAATRPGGIPVVQPYVAGGPFQGQPMYTGQPAIPYSSGATVEPGSARDRDRRRRMRSRTRRASEWAWVVVAVALFGVTLIASLSIFMVLRMGRTTLDQPSGMTAASATAVVIVPTAVPNLDWQAQGPEANSPQQAVPGIPADINSLGIEPWDGRERFTILIMGWDRRPGDPPDAAYRTDTMILVSLDPTTNRIGILSIPRDLYVNIPGYSQLQRVNSAYVLGELRQPGYGPRMAMETVQYNLGIRVHDYLIVDFNAFIKVVDAIGGIDIDVPYNIADPQYPDMNYGYDPFYITAGRHHLDGATALKYARTRHGSSDFRRAERQQQVLFAIRDRILDVNNLPQLVVAAPAIWASIQDGIRTGLTFDQIIRLGWYAKDIPLENIHTGVIDEEYITFYTTPTGASVVIPNRYALGRLMVQVFGENYNR